jgi:kynurenine formamidase
MFDGAPTMAMDPKLSISWHCTLDTLGYNLSRLITSTHQGTHIDAPKHFFKNGETIDQIPLERCIVPAVKVDLTHKAPNEPILPSDLEPYERHIEQGCSILLHTGWDKFFPQDAFFSNFPYVSKALADHLAEKKVNLIGMDMPTPNGTDWKYVHVKLLGAGVLIVEGLANMEQLPADEPFTFYALPLKLQGRDGSPIRAIATLNQAFAN